MEEKLPDPEFETILVYIRNKLGKKATLRRLSGLAVFEGVVSKDKFPFQIIVNQWYATTFPPYIDLVGVELKGQSPAGVILMDEVEGRFRLNGIKREDEVDDNDSKWMPQQIWTLIENHLAALKINQWRVFATNKKSTGYDLVFPAGISRYLDSFDEWAVEENLIHLSPSDVSNQEFEQQQKKDKAHLVNLAKLIENAPNLQILEEISFEGLSDSDNETYQEMYNQKKIQLEMKTEDESVSDDDGDDDDLDDLFNDDDEGGWEKPFQPPPTKRRRDLG